MILNSYKHTWLATWKSCHCSVNMHLLVSCAQPRHKRTRLGWDWLTWLHVDINSIKASKTDLLV